MQLPRVDTLPDDLTQAGSVPTRPVGSAGPAVEPMVGQASPAGWRTWLVMLFRFGQERIAAFGLTLGLGLAAAMLALYVFAVLADEVMEEETLRVDNAVLATLRLVQSPFLDDAAWFVSMLGAEILAVLLVSLVGVLGWQRRWGAAVSLLVIVGGAQLLNNVLKDWFHRTRPAPVDALIPAQAFSFPSGHAMVAAAFYLFVGYLAWRLLAGRARIICVGLLALVAFLVGLSRLYLGVHYLTDVVAGYVAGIAWTQAVIIGGQLLARRGGRPAPLAPGQTAERAAPRPLRGDLRVPADAGGPECR